MNRNVLWIFLLTAGLASAGSLDSFQATCSLPNPSSPGVCSGSSDSSFSFNGPFLPQEGSHFFAPGQVPGAIDFGIGSLGGGFTYQGDPCNYGLVIIDHKPCDGEVVSGSSAIVTPSATGLSLGDVVSVVGPGTAQGFFCDPCNEPARPSHLIFDIPVSATYQFTLTAPGARQPFTLTGAQVSSVPEPGTWVFTTLGLAGVAAADAAFNGVSVYPASW